MTDGLKLKVNMISETTFTVRGHGVHTAFKEMTSALAARDDVDIKVNTFRKADIIHIQTVGGYSLLALLFGRGKKVISVHVIPDSFIGSLIGAKYWYKPSIWYLRFFYGRADLLLAVSEVVKTTLKGQLKITKPIEVVYNTVDGQQYQATPEQRQQARQKLTIDPNKVVVIGNGQIQPRKRFDVFVKTASQLPDYQFIWIGGIPFKKLGADFQSMQDLITNATANVLVTGVIELEAVRQYFWAGDIFFLPSNQENHPLAVIEAAASNLPVVLRDIPEYEASFGQDYVRGNDETFVSIIKKLIEDKDFYSKSVQGAHNIANRFDNKAGGQRLVDAYRWLLDSTHWRKNLHLKRLISAIQA